MTLIYFKVIAIVAIFTLTLLSGLLPLRFAVKNTQFLHLSDAFAGGIFLSAGLLHLLPDAEASFRQLYGNNAYPFAQLYCIIACVFLLFLEKSLVIYGNKKKQQNAQNLQHQHLTYEIAGCCHHKTLFTPILLLIILTIHSFVEGLAIGISSNIVEAIVIFVAVIVHKGSESLALTNNLYRYKINVKNIIKLIVIFSCMTPLGIFLASLVNTSLDNHFAHLLEAIFNACASGTFVYLGTIHVVECEKSLTNLKEILALILGITVMSVVALWV